jgi:hypothetical protein
MPKSGHAASRLESLAPSVTEANAHESGDWFRDPAVVYRRELEIDQRVAEQTARRAVAVLAAPVQRQAVQRQAVQRQALARLAVPHAAAPSRSAAVTSTEDAAAEGDVDRPERSR